MAESLTSSTSSSRTRTFISHRPSPSTDLACATVWRLPGPPPIRPPVEDPHELLSAFSPSMLIRLAAQMVVPFDKHKRFAHSRLARWFEQCTKILNKTLYSLSADPLSTLTSYNVLRGFVVNLIILGVDTPEHCEMDHCFKRTPGLRLPPDLLPTDMQESMHPAWIDMFPSPKARDNLIKRLGQFDEDELCGDMLGHHNGIYDDCKTEFSITETPFIQLQQARGRPGLILWSDPWEGNGWEVTPEFLFKWAWVWDGCHDIIDATNRWRAERDEEPIFLPSQDP